MSKKKQETEVTPVQYVSESGAIQDETVRYLTTQLQYHRDQLAAAIAHKAEVTPLADLDNERPNAAMLANREQLQICEQRITNNTAQITNIETTLNEQYHVSTNHEFRRYSR